jgi:hypothetical protein
MLAAGAECDECESHLEPYQGPPTPPRFAFTVKEAATALVEVANGGSYNWVGATAWHRAGRVLLADQRASQLAANWVETLTPIATASLRETEWPQTIVCDSTNYFYKDPATKQSLQAFAVLAVWGYEPGPGKGRLWALSASHGATGVDWLELFNRLDGCPDLVVCDGAGSVPAAAANRWPQVTPRVNWAQVPAEPFVFGCEYHLRKNALEKMHPYGLEMDAQIMKKLELAFDSPQGWAAFRRAVAQSINVDAWCATVDAQVRAQSSWRPRLPAHHSNGAVEAAIERVREVISDRSVVLRNKYRTNQLLELVRAGINHQADVTAFARALRTGLEAGALPQRQLRCIDPGTRTRRINEVLVPATQVSSLRQ